MTTHPDNKILWTATQFTLPQDLWKRLESQGYKVLIADKDIIHQIESLSPKLWVGQIDGEHESDLSQFQKVKAKYPHMPVVLMSPKPNIDQAIQAIKLGAFEYIPGDISIERLWAILEGALKTPSQIHRLSSLSSLKTSKATHDPIAVHPSMLRIMELAKKVAPSRSTVLMKGETGVGKEVMARYIHHHSDRRDGPFIAINCAALPENLLESELFGHEKGAFTGAITRKKGKFELANGGILLLDEISEMAVSVQAKLLRVLQEREIDRVGGQMAVSVDVRVIATTNRDLEAETKNGHFRLDLFYRLNVVPITLPPLRKRLDDIEPLAKFFLTKYCSLNNCTIKEMAPDAVDFLKSRAWPGNVREFENMIERVTILVESEVIHAVDLELLCNPEEQADIQGMENGHLVPLKEMEKRMIFQALDNHSGNRTHAAKVLGISVRTLRNKLHEYKDILEREEVSANG